MKPEDIIGKKITCFEFKPIDHLVIFSQEYKNCIGKTGIVKEINITHPQYAYVRINTSIGKSTHLHYPTQMIIDQLQYENKSTEDLLNDMKQLMSRI
jgi:hypothetical protein